MSGEIERRLARVKEAIANAESEAGRERGSVSLLAVSKKFPAEEVVSACRAGQQLFGENYVAEAKAKIPEVHAHTDKRARFHLIGHLQSNKAKEAVRLFDVIQTLDRESLAKTLSKACQEQGVQQKVMVQINISKEQSKSGVAPERAGEFCQAVSLLPGLSLCGLMCIGSYIDPQKATEEERSREFAAMNLLRDRLLAEEGLELPELSMGMSHDFELAIAHGATIVRVGSAIFGERR